MIEGDHQSQIPPAFRGNGKGEAPSGGLGEKETGVERPPARRGSGAAAPESLKNPEIGQRFLIGRFDAGVDKGGRNLHPLADHHIEKQFLKKAGSLLLSSGFRDEPKGEFLEFRPPLVRQPGKDGREDVVVARFGKGLKDDQSAGKAGD